MQLDKMVNYHKALADPTRMRILLLLSRGEMHGQALAKKLNLSQPTVTHHASKLREAGLIKERRDKNTVYFTLNPELIRQHAEATVRFIFEKGEGEEEMSELNETLEASVLRNFFSKDGKLRQIPAQYKKKLIVLQMLAEKLEPGRMYPERELNEWIKQYHEDFATIRRELIMHQFMYREREMYELNPREMWTRWDQVH
ncbi:MULTISPECIES: metalloregulator ArsR/SmtB family transcription factor [Paenibacillus]|jgi:biotin operon repressor|uniref:ArsR family transcriptional regulator n=2 Tax=Paenibacillus TaxID=44249 RepID=A0ABX2ZCM2_PAEPO|nr:MULTISPECIES: metalloregulator ArsR/SmtB family transcription factor [Paenibacillus]MCP3745139.1 metalloregulator ArsR/SmtB family transcription factor [Paenibacillus sp. A3M_27_13]MDR6779085.1 biotin operon repressor [Paenibacillus peoriae]ODA07920.1 ArsR family transcriptional regulator [Paenibacillus polymyxa]OME75025.1 ArsR family transcriptional regulator [Paenibacillus peoriae]OMF35354.1 ArsR family transcriptional regulator [Paenibacillus peoriae]